MKINDIVNESTTAGSIATVAAPMTTQSRNASIYGGKKVGNLLTGKKTNKKYANSISEDKDYKSMSRDEKMEYHRREMNAAQGKATSAYQYHKDQLAKFKKPVKESKMKELATDIRNMDNGNFKKKYGNTKEHFKATLGDPDAKKTVHEADLQEDDLILVPGQGRSRKTGFIKHGESRLDHEVEMARSDLFSAAKNAKQVYEFIADVTEEEGLEGWVQEKIIKANDYLNTIREYLEGKQLQNEMTGGVIAAGGVGESRVDELSSALLSRAASKAAFRQRDTAKALHNLENEPGSYFDPEMRGRPGDAHPARKFWSDKAEKFANAAIAKRNLAKEKSNTDAATSQMSPAQKRKFTEK